LLPLILPGFADCNLFVRSDKFGKNKFSSSLAIKVCALESAGSDYIYPEEVKYTLNTSDTEEYKKSWHQPSMKMMAVKLVLIQHEFGFFRKQEQAFQQFLSELMKACGYCFSYGTSRS
jgi:hypothetical protein